LPKIRKREGEKPKINHQSKLQMRAPICQLLCFAIYYT
jgi:hypothetical protein